MTIRYQTHHIIPRHLGGTDEPSNLVRVSEEQHAELHLALYLEHGDYRDWKAASVLLALSKKTDEEMADIYRRKGEQSPETRRAVSALRSTSVSYTHLTLPTTVIV